VSTTQVSTPVDPQALKRKVQGEGQQSQAGEIAEVVLANLAAEARAALANAPGG
jgi:hypothetical protein